MLNLLKVNQFQRVQWSTMLFVAWMVACGTLEVSAHPAHETFAEMVWNPAEQRVEVALRIRGIDLEQALSTKGHRIDLEKEREIRPLIIGYLKKNFVLSDGRGMPAKMNFVGMEMEERWAWLYFTLALPPDTELHRCRLTNRILFETLDGQVNKVELRSGEDRQHLVTNRRQPTANIQPIATDPAASWQPPAALDTLPSVPDLPDLFQQSNGQRVSDVTSWEARRSEMKRIIQYFEYGHLPPRPQAVIATDVSRKPFREDKGTEERLTLLIGPQRLPMSVLIHLPADGVRSAPWPVVISAVHRNRTDLPCLEMFLANGYAFVQYQREDLDPDRAGVVGPAQKAYPDFDWATLAVWAWGGMRVVDYLEQRDDLDCDRIAITGHSRGGKAALLAGALDERFQLVAPNGSGCGGAGCFRNTPSTAESLAKITDPKRFGYWFHPRLRWFAGREDKLPFDQHFVKALVAPRALLCTEARGDLWANPTGTRRTSLAARDAYAFLDASDKIGLTYREGSHDQTMEDWQALLRFAEWHFYDRVPDNPKSFWESP